MHAVLRERPDIAIVDIRMPPTFRDEGLRAALELRERAPETAVLIISQYVEEHVRARAARRRRAAASATCSRTACWTWTPSSRRCAASERAARRSIRRSSRIFVGHREDRLAALTPRENEVLALMAEGRSNASIAEALVLTVGAVEKHVASILQKLRLPPSDETHRRVLAVLAYLDSA